MSCELPIDFSLQKRAYRFDPPEGIVAPYDSPTSVRYSIPTLDVAPRRVIWFQTGWKNELGAGAEVRIEPKKWSSSPGFVMLKVRENHILVLSSAGHAGLALVRHTQIESMMDIFESQWLVPWAERPEFRRESGASNRLETITIENRMKVLLNGTVIGECDDASACAYPGVGLWVASNGNLAAIVVDKIGIWDPLPEAPFTGVSCWLQVNVEDRLNTESGAPSASGMHEFFVLTKYDWMKAPALEPRMRRVVEKLYQRLNAESADGTSYTVLDVKASLVLDTDLDHRDKRYRMNEDGTLGPY
jgi:hypothetical protein